MGEKRCFIVGAGLAGLLAANVLQQHGWRIIVLEQAETVGGRLATRRLAVPDGRVATFDAGAQFFTVRSNRFRSLVSEWLAASVVVEWSRGFAAADGSYYHDGHPRYRGAAGMDSLAIHLAKTVDVRLNCRVHTVRSKASEWFLETVPGEIVHAPALILALPVGQALALLQHGDVQLPPNILAGLSTLTYDPCLALLVVLAGDSAIPTPGGMWPGEERISWLADNRMKGISELPAVTIHGSAAFSHMHYTAEASVVAEQLLQDAAPYLGNTVQVVQLDRWRYSIPRFVHPQRYLSLPGMAPLLFAGDAFAGPRIEGAVLSGIAAAEALLTSYED